MEEGRKTVVIAVGNQKGGVGKTTTTVHLATALAEMGRQVLVIDLDMNRGATRHFGIPEETFLGSFEVLIGEEEPEDITLRDGEEEGVHLPKNLGLVPARRNLESVEKTLSSNNKFRVLQDILINPLKTIEGKYDYVFLDTAPNATAPTIAAYKAAHYFILTALPEPFAIQGLSDALEDIRDAQRNGNPRLRLLGVVLGGVDGRKTRLATSLITYVDEHFVRNDGGPLKFSTSISRSIHIPEAQKSGKTLFELDPTHKVCEQFRKLAQEFDAGVKAELSSHTAADTPRHFAATDSGEETTDAVGNG
jgi:chromosome partitioning protein